METWIQRIFLTGACAASLLAFAPASLAATAETTDSDVAENAPLIKPDVRPKRVKESLIDTENFEIGSFAGVINIEDFESSFLWGARLAYHVTESFFAEANIGFADAGETSFERLAGNVQVLPDDDRDYTFYNLNLGYILLPGEAYVGDRYAFNTNFYLLAGVGATDFAGDKQFTVNFGAGYQVLLTDALAVNLEFREHLFDMDLLGESKTVTNTQVSMGLSFFF